MHMKVRNEVSFDQLILVSGSVSGFLLAGRRAAIPWQTPVSAIAQT